MESIALLILASAYLIYNWHQLEKNAVWALLVTAIYLIAYLFVPPTLEITSMRVGLLFGYVPFVSLGAILFPQLNPHSPVQVTRAFGWIGLLAMVLILCVLKLFVW